MEGRDMGQAMCECGEREIFIVKTGECTACYARRKYNEHREKRLAAGRAKYHADPAAAREKKRKYRESNVELIRERGRRYYYENLGTCGSCGRTATPGTDACRACRSERAEARRREITQMWNDGTPMKAIASDLGMTANHLKAEMGRMRAAGHDLPSRYAAVRARKEA